MTLSFSTARRRALVFSLPLLLISLALLATGLNASRQDSSGSRAANEPAPRGVTVFLVRHAEKATDDRVDPTLTAAGEERARDLARLLSSAGVSHLYSSDYQRTRLTLAPLAEAGKLEVLSYDAGQPLELVKRLEALPAGSVAVVSGHSNTTPGLYEALGAGEARELEKSLIPDAAYDRLYVVTLLAGPDGEVTCVDGFELRFGKRNP